MEQGGVYRGLTSRSVGCQACRPGMAGRCGACSSALSRYRAMNAAISAGISPAFMPRRSIAVSDIPAVLGIINNKYNNYNHNYYEVLQPGPGARAHGPAP